MQRDLLVIAPTNPRPTFIDDPGSHITAMFPSLPLFSRTTYRGAKGSGAGRSGKTAFRSSPDSRKSNIPVDGLWMKRSQRGLYHGVTVQSGHNVPKSRTKTKRVFAPNIQHRDVASDLLGRKFQITASTKALRTIRKKGGLDAYLCDTKDRQLGIFGQQLRDHLAAMAASRASDSDRLEAQQAVERAQKLERVRSEKMLTKKEKTKTAKKDTNGQKKDGEPKPATSDTTLPPTFASPAHRKAHNMVSRILYRDQSNPFGPGVQGNNKQRNA